MAEIHDHMDRNHLHYRIFSCTICGHRIYLSLKPII